MEKQENRLSVNFQISLNIPDIEILKVEKNKVDDLIITVKSKKRSCPCSKCGKEAKKIHGYGEAIILRHLSVFDQRVYLRLRPARYQCEYCQDRPTSTEETSWYNKRSKFTKVYEDYLMKMLINSTFTDVSFKEGVSYDDMEGVIDRQIAKKINWQNIQKLTVIGLDEIALKKGHKDFIVIISARLGDEIKVLAILPDREKKTVKAFIQGIPDYLKRTIKTACCDMYEGYINAVKETLGSQVKVVIDRFHVAKNYRKGVDSLRKQELKRLKKELTENEYKTLKGAMWALRKKEEQLKEHEKEVLIRLFSYSPLLKQAYDFQNSLTTIFNQNINKREAEVLIKKWIAQVKLSELTCFDTFISTLIKHWDDILNYFSRKRRRNSGFVEGLNNKIKVIKRRCYGIFNLEKLFQRIFLDIEGYARFAH